MTGSLKDLDSAVKVLVHVARCSSTIAGGPVNAVNLPETNVYKTIGVVELGMSVSAALMAHNALTA